MCVSLLGSSTGDADDIAGGFIRLNVEPLIGALAGYQLAVMLVNHVDAVPQLPSCAPVFPGAPDAPQLLPIRSPAAPQLFPRCAPGVSKSFIFRGRGSPTRRNIVITYVFTSYRSSGLLR